MLSEDSISLTPPLTLSILVRNTNVELDHLNQFPSIPVKIQFQEMGWSSFMHDANWHTVSRYFPPTLILPNIPDHVVGIVFHSR